MTTKTTPVATKPCNVAHQDRAMRKGFENSHRLEARFRDEGIETAVTFLSDPKKFLIYSISNPNEAHATAKIRALPFILSVTMTTNRDPRILKIVVQMEKLDDH